LRLRTLNFRLGSPDFRGGTFYFRFARDGLRVTFDSFKTLFCRLHRIVTCVYGLTRPFAALLVTVTTTMASIPALIYALTATIIA
jgi:hypothetical protein